jgi:hypothetical protein
MAKKAGRRDVASATICVARGLSPGIKLKAGIVPSRNPPWFQDKSSDSMHTQMQPAKSMG